eukprot:75006_1
MYMNFVCDFFEYFSSLNLMSDPIKIIDLSQLNEPTFIEMDISIQKFIKKECNSILHKIGICQDFQEIFPLKQNNAATIYLNPSLSFKFLRAAKFNERKLSDLTGAKVVFVETNSQLSIEISGLSYQVQEAKHKIRNYCHSLCVGPNRFGGLYVEGANWFLAEGYKNQYQKVLSFHKYEGQIQWQHQTMPTYVTNITKEYAPFHVQTMNLYLAQLIQQTIKLNATLAVKQELGSVELVMRFGTFYMINLPTSTVKSCLSCSDLKSGVEKGRKPKKFWENKNRMCDKKENINLKNMVNEEKTDPRPKPVKPQNNKQTISLKPKKEYLSCSFFNDLLPFLTAKNLKITNVYDILRKLDFKQTKVTKEYGVMLKYGKRKEIKLRLNDKLQFTSFGVASVVRWLCATIITNKGKPDIRIYLNTQKEIDPDHELLKCVQSNDKILVLENEKLSFVSNPTANVKAIIPRVHLVRRTEKKLWNRLNDDIVVGFTDVWTYRPEINVLKKYSKTTEMSINVKSYENRSTETCIDIADIHNAGKVLWKTGIEIWNKIM